MATSEGETGERVLFLATDRYPVEGQRSSVETVVGTDGVEGRGTYAVGMSGHSMFKKGAYAKYDVAELTERIWSHTMKAFEVIGAGQEFKD
jgi:hypothetical protein